MFLNYLKNFFLKYTLKNKWQSVSTLATANTVQTIGVVVDESNFLEKDHLIESLVSHGFSPDAITIIVYRDSINKKETYSKFTFDLDAVNWNGVIKNAVVNQFIETKFDLLVSYYDIEKPILLLITNNSKAQFKVGFSSVDQRLHHLMITTDRANYSVFVRELVKYLKILNKIKA